MKRNIFPIFIIRKIKMLLFPNEQFKRILDYITRNHKPVLSSFIIDELTAVVARKFSKKKDAIDSFLSNLSYELVYTPRHMPGNLFDIRDINDYPILYTAIIESIAIFIFYCCAPFILLRQRSLPLRILHFM